LLHAEQAADPTRSPLCVVGAWFRAAARRLSQEPRCGTPPPSDDLCRVHRNIGADGLSLRHHPKGFFPQQDTGLIFGTSETAQDISFPDAVRRQQALAEIVGKDSAVATVGMSLGASGTQPTQNRRALPSTKSQLNMRFQSLSVSGWALSGNLVTPSERDPSGCRSECRRGRRGPSFCPNLPRLTTTDPNSPRLTRPSG